jgi:hypothetical protein
MTANHAWDAVFTFTEQGLVEYDGLPHVLYDRERAPNAALEGSHRILR